MANNLRYIPDTRGPHTPNKDMVEVIVNLSPQSKANITISPQSCMTTSNNDMTSINRQVSLNMMPQTLHAVFDIILNEEYGDDLIPVTSMAYVKLDNTGDI